MKNQWKFLFVAFWPGLLAANEVILNSDFSSDAGGWHVPGHFPGKVEVVKDGGRTNGALKLTPVVDQQGRNWSGMVANLAYYTLAGRTVKMSGYVRGKGTLKYSFWVNVARSDGKPDNRNIAGPVIVLTPEWQYFEHSFGGPEQALVDICPQFTLSENGEAFFDDIKIECVTTGNQKITVQPVKSQVKVGMKLPAIEFSTGKPGEQLIVFVLDGNKQLVSLDTVTTDAQGKCRFESTKQIQAGDCKVIAAKDGRSATAEISVTP